MSPKVLSDSCKSEHFFLLDSRISSLESLQGLAFHSSPTCKQSSVIGILQLVLPPWMLTPDVSPGCQPRMSAPDVRPGCQPWMLALDVSPGCQPWILALDVSPGC